MKIRKATRAVAPMLCALALAFTTAAPALAAPTDTGKWYSGSGVFHGKVSDGNYSVGWDASSIELVTSGYAFGYCEAAQEGRIDSRSVGVLSVCRASIKGNNERGRDWAYYRAG
jgi:hydrogenase/urease accessory protein HupE